MALEIRKKEKESTPALIHRFTRKLQKSGILLEARKRQFKGREKSREAKKREALRREELKRYYEKLKKLGKLE